MHMVFTFFACKTQVKMITNARTDGRADKWMRRFALGLVNLHSCLLLTLIYIKCEWLLNRVEGLVQELGNSPFLKTQWNRRRGAYAGIWMVNRWITQSNVFLCRLAGIVLCYLCICARERESEMGAWRSGDSSFPIVLRSGQKYLQCQEVFWKIFEKKIQYRADLLLGICKEIHSASNLV